MATMQEQELNFFNAESGARSSVTEREATGDKSVTIDRNEKFVLFSKYPADSFTRAGGALPDGKPTMHKFNVYDVDAHTFRTHDIAVKYPKSKGNELRLYFNRASSFYPNSDHDWFIFTQPGEPYPYIGMYHTNKLDNLISGEEQRLAFEHDYALDEEDNEYLKAVASPQAQKGTTTYQVTSQKRDATLAANCIKKAHYKCQSNEGHISFISATSGQQYVEVHHLIPISKSDNFEHSLDVEANLIVLCPNCHRAIHYGTEEVKRELLDFFIKQREDALGKAGINVDMKTLYLFYGIRQD